MAAFRIIRRLRDLLDFTLGTPSDGDRVTYDAATGGFILETPLVGEVGAPTDADYLVGTANGGLSAEIVVGTSPGGELGGTWGSPTVDATHSGSSHAGVQAAAEATAAAALGVHEADTSAAHAASAIAFTPAGTIAATDVQAAIAEVAAEATGASFATPTISLGSAAAAGAAATVIRSDSTIVAFDATVPSTQAFGDAAAAGSAAVAARRDHKHAMPAATTDATIATTDVTTNDVSTSKHGWAPKAPNDATKFLNGVGAYAVPAGASLADAAILAPAASARNVIQPTGAAVIPLIVRGAASQSASLQQWQDSAGAPAITAKASGNVMMAGAEFTDTFGNPRQWHIEPTGAQMNITRSSVADRAFFGGTAGSVGLAVLGFSGQSVDIFQVQDSASAKLMGVTTAGLLSWIAGNEQTTVGAAGGGSALPATPTKYLKVKDSAGTTLIIPAYAAA